MNPGQMSTNIHVVLALALVSPLCLPIQAGPPIKNRNGIDYIELHSTIYTIVRDQEDPDSFLVGTKNYIYRIDSSLHVQDFVQNGPANDSLLGLHLGDQENRIIFLTKDKRRQMIACGTIQRGMCWAHDYPNITYFQLINDNYDSVNFLSNNGSSVVFQIEGEELTRIIVAFGRPYELSHESLPLFSTRVFIREPQPHFAYANGNKDDSGINVVNDYYGFHFVHTFKYEQFIYFIFHYDIGWSTGYSIGRVCQDDTSFSSYTELPLACDIQILGQVYSRIDQMPVTAHVGVIGPKMAKKLKVEAGDFLYIALDKKDEFNSYVCGIGMDRIDFEFELLARKCSENITSAAKANPSFHEEHSHCTPDEFSIEFCGVSHSKRHMLGSYDVNLHFVLQILDRKIVSLITYNFAEDTFALAATADGSVLKIFLSADSGPIILLDKKFASEYDLINSSRSAKDNDQSVISEILRPQAMISSTNKFALIAAGNTIVKFPIYNSSCEIYPLTDGMFSALSGNDTNCASLNPVKISSFTPRSGPLEGGTKIAIRGEGFGNWHENMYRVELILANNRSVDCSITLIGNELMYCDLNISAPIKAATSGKLKLTVPSHCYDSGYYCTGGEALSKMPFTFYDPVVKSTDFLFESQIAISGAYLDIGSRRAVSVAYSTGSNETCKIISTESDEINCNVSGKFAGSSGYVIVSIDSKVIATPFSLQRSNSTSLTTILIPVVMILVFAVISITVYYRRKKVATNSSNPSIFLVSEDHAQLSVLKSHGKLIAKENLKIGDRVGGGNFGVVHKGEYTDPNTNEAREVAMKTMSLISSVKQLDSLIEEALIMHEFDHPNVLGLIGLSLPKDSLPIIITPYMKNGDLLNYMRNERAVPLTRMIRFILDISRGMKYLADQKCVHRDLAARNCMLDETLNVRVADFGLTRSLTEKGYYKMLKSRTDKQGLPLDWMPPESLRHRIFNTKTDVWAYGVTCWEVFSRLVTCCAFVSPQLTYSHL